MDKTVCGSSQLVSIGSTVILFQLFLLNLPDHHLPTSIADGFAEGAVWFPVVSLHRECKRIKDCYSLSAFVSF